MAVDYRRRDGIVGCLILIVSIYVSGCQSGRFAEVHHTTEALFVRDLGYPYLACVHQSGIRYFKAGGVVSMNPTGKHAVLWSTEFKLRTGRLVPEKSDEIYVPLPLPDTRFAVLDLATGKRRELRQELETDAKQIGQMYVDDCILAVELRPRYFQDMTDMALVHYACDLENGNWTMIGAEEWERIKAAATSRVEYKNPNEAEVPDWGTVIARRRLGGWETILGANNGSERRLLRQNDLGLSELIRMFGCSRWP